MIFALILGFLIYSFVATDIGEVLLVTLLAFTLFSLVVSVTAFSKSRKLEFYQDYVRVLGYGRDGRETIDLPYSSVEVGPSQLVDRLSMFLISLKVNPLISWVTRNKVIESDGRKIPLTAWIRAKRENLTEDQMRVEIQHANERLTSFNRRLRPVAIIVFVVAAALVSVGFYLILALVRESALSVNSLILPAGLVDAGLFMAVFVLFLFSSTGRMLRSLMQGNS